MYENRYYYDFLYYDKSHIIFLSEKEELQNLIRLNTIEALQENIKTLEKDAKRAEKEEQYAFAAEKYQQAANNANEIFKLGVTEMTKEYKRLINKSKENERLS